ncbi:MAG: TetR/AcrR family transcriptional regulator [Nevskiales bacterium]
MSDNEQGNRDLRSLDKLAPSTRARIETAVLDTFAGREFQKVSLIEIARSANVSLQTIYKYYGDKETLLFSSLDTWLTRLAKRMTDHLQGIEDYKERFRKVFWVALEFFQKNPDVALLIMSSVYLNTWRKYDTFRQPEFFNLFMQVIKEGRHQGVLNDEVEERYILDFVLGTCSRLISMWIIRGQQDKLTDDANLLFEMLWRAISKPE